MGSPKPDANVNRMAEQNQNQFSDWRSGFQNFVMPGAQGALDRSNQVFNTALGGYQSLLGPGAGVGMGGGGGGINPATLAALQGLSGPGNPWAGQLGTDIRTREDSLLPGFYDRIKAEQTRLQNIQGGYNPGFTQQMSKLARDQAQQAQAAKLNTEIKLGERSAAAQAAGANFEMQKQLAIAKLQAGAAAGNRAAASDLARLQLSALGGLQNLREQTPGELAMFLQAGLGNMGLQGQANQGIGNMMQYNQPQIPGWQRALGMVPGLAMGFGSMFGGGGGAYKGPGNI